MDGRVLLIAENESEPPPPPLVLFLFLEGRGGLKMHSQMPIVNLKETKAVLFFRPFQRCAPRRVTNYFFRNVYF